ncbi:hypothetical protein MMPV_004549 [Pyropia vietnamensis]
MAGDPPVATANGEDPRLPLFSTLLLAGDVGGTNARLVLYAVPPPSASAVAASDPSHEATSSHVSILHRTYKSADYPSFSSVISAFLLEASTTLPSLLQLVPRPPGERPLPLGGLSAAAFAVAGPVEGGRINFTNREGWILDSAGLAEEFGIPSVKLVNDFVANGYGVLTLTPEETVVVQEGKADPGGVMALLGAGTGLGQCFLTADAAGGSGEYTAWGSEGGHVDWAPTTGTQAKLLRFLHKRFGSGFDADGGVTPLSPSELADAATVDASVAPLASAVDEPPLPRISVERVVSGRGLANIYAFLSSTHPSAINPPIHETIVASAEPGRAIAAGAYNCSLCAATMDIFFDAYATAVGNVALTYLPTGGLYVAGGIAPKNMEYVTAKKWAEALRRKGRLSGVVGGMRVAVVVKEDLGLRGAHIVATRLWDRNETGKTSAASAPMQAVNGPPSTQATAATAAAAAAGLTGMSAGLDGMKGPLVQLGPWGTLIATNPVVYTAAAVAAGAGAVAAIVSAARYVIRVEGSGGR